MKTEISLSTKLAARIVEVLPLASIPSRKRVKRAIAYCRQAEQSLVLVSTVCPSYSVNKKGRPDYRELETKISANTRKHLEEIPRVVEILDRAGVKASHHVLMADTEVDLLPFLQNRLKISPTEFTRRCAVTIEEISSKLTKIYGAENYANSCLPKAARFLEFFGQQSWYERYDYFQKGLLSHGDDLTGRVARALARDFETRSEIVESLLGKVELETGMEHIARQKAQYMAFCSLMGDMLPGRLVIINHRTPNFHWMNDYIRRDRDFDRRIHTDPVPGSTEAIVRNLDLRFPRQRIPLLELDISTTPND